ncbi:MAG: hypothetical protein ACI4QX_00440 [Lachnospiraceae bacterium]
MTIKKRIVQLTICIALLAVVWGVYAVFMREINHKIEPCVDDFSWVYQVDSVAVEGEEFVLTGFAFKLGKNAEKRAFDIVLQDIETGKNYFPKMQYSERKDVNDYFFCEYDYLNSGFTARIKANKLDLQNGNYEVILQIDGRRKAYQTGTYLSKGQLMYVNPNEFVPLEVEGTDLEEIVEKGVLRIYRPDFGMYVYQYEGELYWIAEKEYEYASNDVLEYLVKTTQVANLPQNKSGNNYSFDNIGFVFISREITDWDTGKYRVAKKELPTEYSITKIETGNHMEEWIWKAVFRPWYDFLK